MADAYISVAGAGAKTGVDAANAYDATQFQLMLNGRAAGDTAFIQQGTYTIAATLTAAVSGVAGNPIRLVGVGPTWVDDGSRFTIDANSTVARCLDMLTYDYYVIKNGEYINSTGVALYLSGGSERVLIFNCLAQNAGSHGIDLGNRNFVSICSVSCVGNGGSGIQTFQKVNIKLSEFIGNSVYGVHGGNQAAVINCLTHNNPSGFYQCRVIDGCTIDGNTYGINKFLIDTPEVYTRNRITHNSSYGIYDSLGRFFATHNNFYYNNGTDVFSAAGATGIEDLGGNVVGTGDGYTNRAADDFSLSLGGEGVGYAQPVGLTDEANNVAYYTMGMPPAYPSAAAPTCLGITRFEPLTNGYFYVEWDAGSGTITGYNIYIKAGSAPTFVTAEIVFNAKFGDTSAIIHVDGSGDFLAHGVDYYCSVRADNCGTEDANIAVLNNICSGPNAIQRQINTNLVIR